MTVQAQTNPMPRPSRTVLRTVLRTGVLSRRLGLSALASASLFAAALAAGGCGHSHGYYEEDRRVVVRQPVAVEPSPLPAAPPVEETVVEEPAPYTPPPAEVTTVYEQDLNPYGHWVEVREYGRCWVPNYRPAGWRPYTVGHWVYTNEGTCWVAEDQEAEYGNVVYHYGRWYEDPSYGWCWVPGTHYAPNWCAWREGGGNCAWAPLPPQCGDGPVDVTIVDRYVPAERYVVVKEEYITRPRIYEHVTRVDRTNVTIINRTTNITNIRVVNNTVINQGVPRERIQKVTGKPVPLFQVDRVADEARARQLAKQGKPVVYAPPVVQHYAEAHPTRIAVQKNIKNVTNVTNVKNVQNTRNVQNVQVQPRDQRARPEVQNNPTGLTAAQKQQQQQLSQSLRQAEIEQQRNQQNPGRTVTPQTPRLTVQERAAQERAAQLREQAARKAEIERQQKQNQNRNVNPQEQPRSAVDRAAEQRAVQERAVQERAAKEKEVQDRAAQAKVAAQERVTEERAAKERAVQAKAAEERSAAEKAAQERAAQQRVTQDRTIQAAQERAAQVRAAQERAAAERQTPKQPGQGSKTDGKSGKSGQNGQDGQDPRSPQR